ncbi:MAG: antiterminator LoaP [Coriobacteriales bacterium]|nr:antiterminator LoaP [Coriobacteriales bacterium]
MILVVQIFAKKEEKVAKRLGRAENSHLWKAFVPAREIQRKRQGVWHTEIDVLFPGYVFVETQSVNELKQAVYALPDALKILSQGEEPATALSPEEEANIKAFIAPGDNILRMSRGLQEGDNIIILEGPLKGFTSNIKDIDRHKRLAWLEIPICGRNVMVKVGLEIVAKNTKPDAGDQVPSVEERKVETCNCS